MSDNEEQTSSLMERLDERDREKQATDEDVEEIDNEQIFYEINQLSQRIDTLQFFSIFVVLWFFYLTMCQQ